MNTTRRLSSALVPAVLLTAALSACQDEAPSAAPPSTPAQPSSAPASPDPGQSGSGAAATPAPSSPAATSAPSAAPTQPTATASSAAGAGAGQCDSTDSFKLRRKQVQPKPLGTAQQATGLGYSKDQGVQVTIGKPTRASSSDDYFPGAGKEALVYPVTIKVTQASYGYSVSGNLGLGMVDGADNACDKDSSTVVARGEQVPIESLKQGESVSGKVAFAVPQGADLSRYSVLWADDYNKGDALMAWSAR